MVTCHSANQLKTPAKVSWAFKMVSQFGSLGYTIMGKTADLTVVQKTIIDTLHKEGKPQTFIAKEAGCSQSAVSKHVNRKLSGRKKCGRKRCTTNRENRSLMRIVKQNWFKNLGELHKEWTEAGVKASRATTHRRVKEFGYSCRIPLFKPLLNHRQRQRRLTWAKEKKNWTVAQWSKVLFSDESKFCISFGNQGPRVWRKGGEAHSPSPVLSFHSQWWFGVQCHLLLSVQLEDRIHWITATLSLRMPTRPRSLPAFGKSDHAAIFLTPEYKQRLAQEPPVKREVTRWSSHSEAMLQAALDDVDWDMFRASSSDVSEFTDVAVSFVNTLTEQATETITVRTFPNQKPWVDRSIRDAVNKRTAAYNEALLSGNMSVYKASCYALRRAVSAAKHRYKERIESHFQLNDSRRMWQGLRTICAFGNKFSAEVSADPSLAEELNTFYGRFDCNGGSAALPSSASGSSRQRSENHVITVSEDEVRRALKGVNIRKAAGPDGITGRVLRSCADQLAGLFTSIFNESLATSVVPTSFKKSIIIPVPKNNKPSCLNDYRPVALTSIVMKVFERLVKSHISSSIPVTLDPLQIAYRSNRSTDDAISHILHSSLTHIDSSNGNYARLLFIAQLSIL